MPESQDKLLIFQQLLIFFNKIVNEIVNVLLYDHQIILMERDRILHLTDFR